MLHFINNSYEIQPFLLQWLSPSHESYDNRMTVCRGWFVCMCSSESSFCKKSEVDLRKIKKVLTSWTMCHACLPSPPFPALSLVGSIHIGAGITVMIWFHPSRCGACKSSQQGLILWHWHGSPPECKVWPVRLLEDGMKGGSYALEYLGHVIVGIMFGVNHPPHVANEGWCALNMQKHSSC